MNFPQPPRRSPVSDEVIIAWADASARLAAELRRAQRAPERPQLCIVRQACADRDPCRTAAVVAIIYWPYARLFHCACQWHLAFEIHPIFRAYHWGVAVAASITWQLYDRLKTIR